MLSARNIGLFSLLTVVYRGLPSLAQIEARPEEFPYMVFMRSNTIDIGASQAEMVPCMGVLIAPQWLLIGGGCVKTFNAAKDKVSPIHSGISPIANREEYSVAQKIIHEKFELIPVANTNVAGSNGIGLLKLSKPVPSKDGFSPIKLASGPFGGKKTLTVPTWSRGSDGKYSKALKSIQGEVIDLNTCRRERPNWYLKNRDKIICGPSVQKGAPFLFKGPVVLRGKRPTEDVLVGMFNLAVDTPSRPGQIYAAITSIGDFRDWIKSKTGV